MPNGLRALLISDLKEGETEESLDQQSSVECMSEDENSSGEGKVKRICSINLKYFAFEQNIWILDDQKFCAESEEEGEEESEEENEKTTKEAKAGGEKLSAAALCVGIGSFSDPQCMPGMAHFLEHSKWREIWKEL